jgi:hypothetical protein
MIHMHLLFSAVRILAAVYKGLLMLFLIYTLLKEQILDGKNNQRGARNRRRAESYQ